MGGVNGFDQEPPEDLYPPEDPFHDEGAVVIQMPGTEDPTGNPGDLLGTVLTRSGLETLPPVEPLVDGLMSTPATVVLVGGYGVGKTFLALSIANAVATGTRWLGRDVHRRRVLYILGEGAYGMNDRMSAWENAWGHKVSDEDVTFLVQPKSLRDPYTWSALTEFAVSGGYGLVIIDTYSSTSPDADETKDAPAVMRHMSNLASRVQGTVMLVHHPGWSDSSRVRGGYQFEANADEVLVATEVAKGSELFTLLRKKVKDGPDGKVFYLRRKSSHGSCIIEETGAREAGAPMADRILMVLMNYGAIGATGPQIMSELEVPDTAKSTLYKALTKLQDEDKVTSDDAKRGKRFYLAGMGGEVD